MCVWIEEIPAKTGEIGEKERSKKMEKQPSCWGEKKARPIGPTKTPKSASVEEAKVLQFVEKKRIEKSVKELHRDAFKKL